MPPNQDTFVSAFRGKMFEMLTGGEPPIGSYLSFLPVGIPVPAPVLNKLAEGDTGAVYDVSVLLNNLPTASGDYRASGGMLWSDFQYWLNNYQPAAYETTAEDKAKLIEAQTFIDANYDNYWKFRDDYTNAQAVLNGLDYMSRSERPKDWEVQRDKAEAALSKASNQWIQKGKKDEFEAAMGNKLFYARRDPAYTRTLLENTFNNGKGIYRGQEYWKTPLLPRDLNSGEVPWAKFIFDEKDIDEYQNTRNVQFGGEASIDAGGFTLEGSVNGEYATKLFRLNTKSMRVEFELIRATIVRPWFDASVLFSKGWRWVGQNVKNPAVGQVYSDGAMPPRDGRLKLIPTEAVFVRNLKCKIDWSSQENKEYKLAIDGEGSVGFSFLKLKARVKWEDQEYEVKSKVTSEGFELETPQIAAFFSLVPPVCPDPDWSLWKDEDMARAMRVLY